jgi:hypothetical protein
MAYMMLLVFWITIGQMLGLAREVRFLFMLGGSRATLQRDVLRLIHLIFLKYLQTGN